MLEALLLRPTAEVRDAAERVDAALVGLDREGFALLPLTERLGGTSPKARAVLGFDYLTPSIAEWAASLSWSTRVAYIHLEFFGDTGFHAALGWHEGAIRWGPRFTANHPQECDERYALAPENMAINDVLRWLGVRCGGGIDEFAAAGLTRFRWTDEWAEANPT